MGVDGGIDPKNYSRDQLVGALNRMSREKYPLNYQILRTELASRPPGGEVRSGVTPSVEESVVPSISVGKVVIVSGLMWAGYIATVAVYSMYSAPHVPLKARWLTVAVLVAIIHICGWMVLRRQQGKLSKPDLSRLAQGCALTFVAIDSGLPHLFEWTGLLAPDPTANLVDVIMGLVIDVVFVLLVVYLSLPILQKLYERRRAA
jgi:hypothetical protein